MEPDELSAALTKDVTVHQARGVLAALLGVSIDDAAVSLDLKAQFSGSSVEEAARQVIDDHTRRISAARPGEVIDNRARALLGHHLRRGAEPSGEPSA